MKSKTLFIVVSWLMMASLFTSCLSTAEKIESAEAKVKKTENEATVAQYELNKLLRDSISEYQQFKIESEQKIAAHEKSIAEFKARIAMEKSVNKAKYEKELSELENKNTDLKRKLEEYKEDSKNSWDNFKEEINHDLDELGAAFKDLTVKNK